MPRADSLQVIGFKNHLEATKADHRGFGYKMWCTLYDAGLNATNLARAFNVSSEIVTRLWIPVFLNQRVIKSKE